MKRLNPETNKPFKYGEKREDGYYFRFYDTRDVKKNGFYREHWASPETWNKNKLRQKAYKQSFTKPNHNHVKRINTKTGKIFEKGDIDKHGRYFIHYQNRITNNSKYYDEYWVDTKEQFFRHYLRRSIAKIRQRSKTRNLKIDIDTDYLVKIYPKDEICPALGIKMEFGGDKQSRFNSPSIDRIIPNKGYTKGNIRFVSFLANAIMNDANADEILKVGKWLKKQNVTRHFNR